LPRPGMQPSPGVARAVRTGTARADGGTGQPDLPFAATSTEKHAMPPRARALAPSEAVRASDHLEHDLVRSRADAVQAHVAPGSLHVVLLHVAVATVDLNCLVANLAG